jgi:hypothetical protein
MIEGTSTAPKGRVTAFRVLAILGAVFLGGFSLFFAIATIAGSEDQQIHALHNVATAAIYVPLFVVPLLLAVRDPAGSAASFRIAIAGSIVVVIIGVIGGTLVSSLITFIVVMLLLWLHPARDEVLRFGALDVPLLAIVAVAAVPAVAYGLDQASLQADRPIEDPHKEFEHYAAMASGSIGLVVAGAVAAFGGRGERIARWLVGLGGAALSASFLAYPDHVSTVDASWAVAGLVGSVLYVAVGELRSRRVTAPRRSS